MNTGTNDQPLQPLPITMTTELGPQSSQKESVPASPQTEKLFKSTVLGKKVKDQKKAKAKLTPGDTVNVTVGTGDNATKKTCVVYTSKLNGATKTYEYQITEGQTILEGGLNGGNWFAEADLTMVVVVPN